MLALNLKYSVMATELIITGFLCDQKSLNSSSAARRSNSTLPVLTSHQQRIGSSCWRSASKRSSEAILFLGWEAEGRRGVAFVYRADVPGCCFRRGCLLPCRDCRSEGRRQIYGFGSSLAPSFSRSLGSVGPEVL